MTSPSLILTFSETDIYTVPASEIGLDDLVFDYNLIKDMAPSSKTVSLTILASSGAVDKILSATKDIGAVLKDGETIVFTGYLSDGWSWSVTSAGEESLSVKLEDPGTRMLKKDFLYTNEEDYAFDGEADVIISEILSRCGISKGYSSSEKITTMVSGIIESGETCQAVLQEILIECGYVYYFDELGALCLYKIEGAGASKGTIDKTKMIFVGDTAVSVSKKLKKYYEFILNWKKTAYRDYALVYRDVSGQDSTHADCYIEVGAGETYPEDTAYTEAEDIENGFDILYMTDVVPFFLHSGGTMECSITKKGAKKLQVAVKNTGTMSGYITKLQATARICYYASDCKTIAEASEITSDSERVKTTEASYIHTETDAKYYANLLAGYLSYSDTTYEFYSREKLVLGGTYVLNEDEFSDITATVLITGYSLNDRTGIYSYEAVSMSNIQFSRATQESSTSTRRYISNTLTSTEYFYCIEDGVSSTEPPESAEWSTERPLAYAGKTIWTKTVYHYSSGSESTEYRADRYPIDFSGDVYIEYAYGDDNVNIPSSSTWYNLADFLALQQSSPVIDLGDGYATVGDVGSYVRNTEYDGKYVWMRSRESEEDDWVYSCLSNNNEDSADPVLQTEVEYSVAMEGYEPKDDTYWGAVESLDWYYGYNYWRRNKYISSKGVVSYDGIEIDEDLTQSAVEALYFTATPNVETVQRNDRKKGQYQTVSVAIAYSEHYKNAKIIPNADRDIIYTASEAGYIVQIPYTVTTEVTLTFTLAYSYLTGTGSEKREINLPVVDCTESAYYLGASSSANPSPSDFGLDDRDFLEGDMYVYEYTVNNNGVDGNEAKIKIWSGSEWKEYSEQDGHYDVLLGASKYLTKDDNHVVTNGIDHFGTLVTQKAVSDQIFTNGLQSTNYAYKTEDGGEVPTAGFKLKGDTIYAYQGKFEQAQITGESSFSGKINIYLKDANGNYITDSAGNKLTMFTTNSIIQGAYTVAVDMTKGTPYLNFGYVSIENNTSGAPMVYTGKSGRLYYVSNLNGVNSDGVEYDKSGDMYPYSSWSEGNSEYTEWYTVQNDGKLYYKLQSTDGHARAYLQSATSGYIVTCSENNTVSGTISVKKGEQYRILAQATSPDNWWDDDGTRHSYWEMKITPNWNVDLGIKTNGMFFIDGDSGYLTQLSSGYTQFYPCNSGDSINGNYPWWAYTSSCITIKDSSGNVVTPSSMMLSKLTNVSQSSLSGYNLDDIVTFSMSSTSITITSSGGASVTINKGMNTYNPKIVFSFQSVARTVGYIETSNIMVENFIGMVAEFKTISAPTGWIKCDGASVAAADYPKLYAVLPSESKTVPDLDSTFDGGVWYIYAGEIL